MRSNFANLKKRKRKPASQVDYQNLEPRQLLATMTDFSGGALTVTVDAAGESAMIDVNANGEVTVNGSRDMDSSTSDVDAVAATSISTLNVNGIAGIANQSANFGGGFDSGNLDELNSNNLTSIVFSGDYAVTGDMSVTMEGVGGSLTDADTSSIEVGGLTFITARNNDVVLDEDVDLQGSLRVSTLGGRDVTIVDNNDLQIASALVSGNLNLTAEDITDVSGATIEVDGAGIFEADSVTLGDNTDDVTNFRTSRFNVSGQVNLSEDSNIIFGNSVMGSLIADSVGGIFDGRSTNVTIFGNANMNADFGVRLGEHGLDTFDAGSLTITSAGHVHVFEDSGTMFLGDTVARTMDITSLGDVTNEPGSSITTSFATGFEGDNVDLGNAAGDTVSLGGVYFWSLGDVNISEDADLFVIDKKNRADRMALRSTGNIADRDDAIMTVDRLSTFQATNVNIGDSLNDRFNSGSIMFDVEEEFFIREDSGLNIAGNNSATTSNIGAAGDVTSAGQTTMEIEDVARFIGQNIDVGNQTEDGLPDDTMNFGSLVFTSPGNVIISEDSSTEITGTSSADLLVVRSAGEIDNVGEASITVNRAANFQAASGIDIGNAVDDAFNAQSVTANTTSGNVLLSEDSSMFLAGTNNANAMTLISTGTIGNAQGTVVDVDTRLTLDAGGLISLGTKVDPDTGDESDRIESGSLVVNTPANATVEMQSDVLFVLSSSANNLNIVARDGTTDRSIRDQPDASIVATESIFFTGLDVIIGEEEFDCLEAGDDINVTASGASQVVPGCPS